MADFKSLNKTFVCWLKIILDIWEEKNLMGIIFKWELIIIFLAFWNTNGRGMYLLWKDVANLKEKFWFDFFY